jgi:uncharacterized membrane protein
MSLPISMPGLPLDLVAQVATQLPIPVEATTPVVMTELTTQLATLQATMTIPTTNIPYEYTLAHPTATYQDWVLDQLSGKQPVGNYLLVDDDTAFFLKSDVLNTTVGASTGNVYSAMEVDTLLSNKAPVTGSTNYAPITGSTTYATGTQLTDGLALKSNTTHNHNGVYLVAADIAGKADTSALASYETTANAALTYIPKANILTTATGSEADTQVNSALFSKTNYFLKSNVSTSGTVNSSTLVYATSRANALFAPLTGSTNYAPITGSTNYAPITGSVNYVSPIQLTAATGLTNYYDKTASDGRYLQTDNDAAYFLKSDVLNTTVGASTGNVYSAMEVDTLLSGVSGAGLTQSAANLLYAPITGSTTYATGTQLTDGLALKSDTTHNHNGVYLVASDIAGKADTSALTSYETVANAALTFLPKASILNTTVGAAADNVYSAMEVDTLLSDKITQTQMTTLVQPFMSNWLTLYINANPSSWVAIRTLLQYYPLTYSTWSAPTYEWVAKPTAYAARLWTNLNGANGLNCSSTNHLSQQVATATAPYAFRRTANVNTYIAFNTTPAWQEKGTWFLVYSWVATEATTKILISNYANTGTGVVNTGPRMQLTRSQFGYTNDAGVFVPETGLPVVDDVVGVPNIYGFSWDWTINPPRFCMINTRYAIEHFGPNEPNELQEITPSGILFTPGTSWNIPYVPAQNSAIRTSTCAFFGSTQTPGQAVDIHYVGQWNQVYFDINQMRTLHMRLLERYTISPFEPTNLRLSEAPTIIPL